ncbi:glycosyltransferase family 8 [Lecanosticta acicola]|uniref:Glycosyltransferase family 8 n=1 Tax=Lecanosticta acicola TaxID=111012 RepID=A0AAI8YW15_9PEZI|nr:glycosyltransferase family 8 [Lecanosticta acicola]
MFRHDSVNKGEQDLAVNDTQKGSDGGRFAYITLVTRASYLAGVVLLAHTLKKQGSQYALIVLYTSTLTKTAVRALEIEAGKSNIILQQCDLLVPPAHHELHVAVERFTDTWTKLRVFDSFRFGYDTICYLDADMTLLQNMDSIFDSADKLPKDWIAAVHDCVCSPDRMPWTPAEHCKENCPFTLQSRPEASNGSVPVNKDSRPTHHLFNSGMFLFHPSQQLWIDMLNFFNATDLLGTFKFPDQEFMTHFFHGRWMPVSWKYNAVKTMAYRHENIWRDNEIVCLHYIVDKPWAKRVGEDGIAGFKGFDGKTHTWWWNEYESWFEIRQKQGEMEVMTIMSKHVARRESELSDGGRPDMGAIGAKIHDVTNKPDRGEASSKMYDNAERESV